MNQPDQQQRIEEILGKMNKCIQQGEGVDYDYYGKSYMVDEPFSLAEATAAITNMLNEARVDQQLKDEHYWIKHYGDQRKFLDGSDGDIPAIRDLSRQQQLHKDRLAHLTGQQANEGDNNE